MDAQAGDWQGSGAVRHQIIPRGHMFLLTEVTSQAKVYKQSLRDFFARDLALTPCAGEYEVEITIHLNPNFPTIDLDNVAKAVLDGLKGHIFTDDSQVMRLLVEKRWAETEQVTIAVWGR
jgi:Holliday junction resolvase RusA-like endonuclease